MPVRSILVITLSASVATLVVFIGLAWFAWINYGLSDLVRETVNRDGRRVLTAPKMLSVRARWNLHRSRWRQSPSQWFIRTVRELVGPFARSVYARTLVAFSAGLLAAVLACSPVFVGRWLQGNAMVAGDLFPRAVFIGALLGVVSFRRAASYSLRAHRVAAATGSVPRFVFEPGAVTLLRRAEFQRRVYLWAQLRFAAGAAGMGGLLVVLAVYGSTTARPEPPRPPGTLQFTAHDLADSLWLASFALVGLVVTALKWTVDRWMPSTLAVVLAHRCLYLDNQRKPKRRWGVVDPLGRRRADLARAARSLTAAARRADTVSGEHPIGSLLHGCARQLRLFSARTDSLAPTFPPAVRHVLQDAIVVIAGPAKLRVYSEIGARIHAFDEDGAPLPVLRATPSRWLSRTVRRAADSLDTYSRFSTSFWNVTTLIMVVALLATGLLDLTSFQLQK